MMPLGSTRRRDCEPRRWRYRIQKQYHQAVSKLTRSYVRRFKRGQIDTMKDRVKKRYARKLAHMWHGPIRALELVDEYAVRLEFAGTEYRLSPVVHVSKIKPVRLFLDRPPMRLTIPEQDRYDFDEALLPEDSWVRELEDDEYEVEKIADMRSGRRMRYGRTLREFLVYWTGYDEPTRVDEVDLKCGALWYDYLRDREVSWSHHEGIGEGYDVSEPTSGNVTLDRRR
ncbi:hypothetical protein PHPALM_28473 [Phytophthora palmivora]|uniref:Chromo domain-containing protein n=1 Tax=Phytophthora palmivora TaxID=4796 RepID=A0A2P4X9Z7_9STRA|nr:hypothetical protein PHPALM_28473 [Phytophthora palmivora]